MRIPNYPAAMGQMLQIAVASRTAEITAHISSATNNIVQSGPFAGMIIPEETSWGNGDIASKLLGTYEQELHPAIEKAIARKPEVVFNVGCAEGYYAIGLARRLPLADICAFDLSMEAGKIFNHAAQCNLVLHARFAGEWAIGKVLGYCPSKNDCLMVVDVEGAEGVILDSVNASFLRRCDVIVECHDFIDRSITETLTARFAATHDVELITEGPRDPNTIPLLRPLSSLDKLLALCEHRPETMNWLACWSKDRA